MKIQHKAQKYQGPVAITFPGRSVPFRSVFTGDRHGGRATHLASGAWELDEVIEVPSPTPRRSFASVP
jgi:hypothetical protein